VLFEILEKVRSMYPECKDILFRDKLHVSLHSNLRETACIGRFTGRFIIELQDIFVSGSICKIRMKCVALEIAEIERDNIENYLMEFLPGIERERESFFNALDKLSAKSKPSMEVPNEQDEACGDEEGCCICFEMKAKITFNPCNHSIFCIGCSTKLLSVKNVCPLCRAKVISVILTK
jgi:hypothetical protein